jgi:hypothetical protein
MSHVTPRHQWTHDGTDVLVVRYVAKDGSSSHGFVYPLTVGADVLCPDWDPAPECGHGLHGWAWGFSIGEGAEPDWAATWLVIAAKPADVVAISGKVKFRAGVVRYVGDWQGATSFVLAGQMAWVHHAASGAASATGWRGAASATGASGAASATGARGAASATGWRGAASATGASGAASATGARGAASATGWSGAASATGESGAASATGERGAASATGASGAASATGWRGAASATGARGAASATGWRGAALATGEASAAVVTGDAGKAQAGEYGCIALAFYNARADRMEMRCARTGGTGGLKPHTWYRLNGRGEFVECES